MDEPQVTDVTEWYASSSFWTSAVVALAGLVAFFGGPHLNLDGQQASVGAAVAAFAQSAYVLTRAMRRVAHVQAVAQVQAAQVIASAPAGGRHAAN